MRILMLLTLFVCLFNYSEAQKKKSSKKTSAPISADSLYRLGQKYHKSKDYKNALDAYSQAEKLNGRVQGLRLNMARAFSATGDVASARQRIDSAIAAGFGNDKLLAQDPEFENLRKTDFYKSLEDRVYANSHPCANLPAARAFDFWLGDWDVYLTSNRAVKTGFNRITSQSGGCVILESWESQGAHSGVSVNYFDPTNGKWKQKWAGSSQDIFEFYDGEYSEGVMAFKSDGVNPDGTKNIGTLTFTKMPTGDVRQHAQQSNDGGKTWTDVYDFMYVRRK